MNNNAMILSVDKNLQKSYEETTKRNLNFQEMKNLLCLYYNETWPVIFKTHYNRDVLIALEKVVNSIIQCVNNTNNEDLYTENDTVIDYSDFSGSCPPYFGVRLFYFIQNEIYHRNLGYNNNQDDDEKRRIYQKYGLN